MVFSGPLRFHSMCRTVLVVKQRSRKERLEKVMEVVFFRKKCMGMWSAGCRLETSRVTAFPARVRRCTAKTTRRRTVSSWGWSEKPSKINLPDCQNLSPSVLLNCESPFFVIPVIFLREENQVS